MPSGSDKARAYRLAAAAAVVAGAGALSAGLGALEGTYAQLLAGLSLVTSLASGCLALSDRGARARDLAGFTLWLMAGAAFAHATHPGVPIGAALTGVLAVLPTAVLLSVSIRATLPVPEPARLP
jgi:hypothetical protein